MSIPLRILNHIAVTNN